MYDSDQSLKYHLKSLNKKFQSIFPHERKRGALFNFFISVRKLISGNLDQEDAGNYDKTIKAINMIKRTNRHMAHTTKLIAN